jgi:hypothetical protein
MAFEKQTKVTRSELHWELPWAGRKASRSTQGIVCRSGTGITLAAEPATSSGCFHKKLWALREQPSAQCQSSSVLVPYTPTRPKQDWSGTWKSSPSLHNEGAGLWSWSHVPSTLAKQCTQSPSECPTRVLEIHPPRGNSESPCFHISRRWSSIVHLDITTKVRTRWVWCTRINLVHDKKGMWLRNGVANGTTYSLTTFWQLWTRIQNLKTRVPKFLKLCGNSLRLWDTSLGMQDWAGSLGRCLAKQEFQIWFLEKSVGQRFTNLSITWDRQKLWSWAFACRI